LWELDWGGGDARWGMTTAKKKNGRKPRWGMRKGKRGKTRWTPKRCRQFPYEPSGGNLKGNLKIATGVPARVQGKAVRGTTQLFSQDPQELRQKKKHREKKRGGGDSGGKVLRRMEPKNKKGQAWGAKGGFQVGRGQICLQKKKVLKKRSRQKRREAKPQN